MSDIRSLDFALLQALDVLLDERSTTRAARRLGLSQSTVSGMLARLRTIFEDPLFVRSQHGLVPTPRAEALWPAVKELLSGAESLLARPRFDPAESTRTFCVSVNDYMQRALIVPLIARLRREAPGLRLAVRPLVVSGLIERTARGEIDLAITLPEFAAPELQARLLYQEHYVGVVRPKHPLAGRKVSLDDFCAHEHLLVSPGDGGFQGPTDEALARVGRRRTVRLSLPSFLLVPEVLASSDLIALAPARLAASFGRRVRSFVPPVPVAGFDVIAAWHRRAQQDPAHAWLRKRLADLAEDMPGSAP